MFESDDDDDYFGEDPVQEPERSVATFDPRPSRGPEKKTSVFDDSENSEEDQFLMSACQELASPDPRSSNPLKSPCPDVGTDFALPSAPRSESRKRRFPGPAGILPRLSTSSLNKIPPIPDSVPAGTEVSRPTGEPSPSQNEIDRATFNSSIWRQMLEDRSIVDEDDPEAPTQKFNIRWVKRKTSQGLSKKTPVLMCAIKSLDLCSVDPSCVLHDRSGDVKATIHRDVMEEYGPYMLPGTVLVLKNVPVIMTVRHHYMALTVNNLVAMYKPKGTNQAGLWAKEVCKLTKEEIEKVSKQLEIEEKRLAAEMIRAQKCHEANSPLSSRPTRPSFPMARAVPRNFNPNHESTPMVQAPPPCSIPSSGVSASSSSAPRLANPIPGSFAPKRAMQSVESPKPHVFKSAPSMPRSPVAANQLTGEDFEGLDEDSMFGDF